MLFPWVRPFRGCSAYPGYQGTSPETRQDLGLVRRGLLSWSGPKLQTKHRLTNS